MRVATIVLSAGESRRMGTPKALLPLGTGATEQSFLARVIATALEGAPPVLVVLGHHAGAIRAGVELEAVHVVQNPSPELGMLSSLKVGLRALAEAPADVTGVLAWPVDHPLVRPTTVARLREEHAAHPGRAIVPRFEGRGGHPALYARTLWPALLALPDEGGARALYERQPRAVVRIDVDDPGVIHDVDTPDDYRKLRGAM